MAEISVVIPIYNVEDYLEECLDSIVNQTFTDLEIICVNDGSKDNSLEILKEYAKKDDRIIVIDQENGGHAVATNVGMDKATGKYLFLMDSDDMLKLDALELTYNAAEEKDVDFVLFQAINYDDEKDQFYEAENYSMNKVADFVGENVFSIDDIGELAFDIAVTPWTKLYNREFIENSHIRFAEGLIFEDNIFFWEVLIQAQRIYFLREHLFYRRWYESSSTMAGDLRFTDSIAINTMIIDVFEKYGKLEGRFENRSYNRKVSLTLLRFQQIKPEFKEAFFDEMQKNFKYWVQDNEFYEYLQSMLLPRNKFILESILKAKTAKELNYLIENYDLEDENRKLNDDLKKIHKPDDSNEKLIDRKNKLLEENKHLTERNEELTGIIENLKNVNNERLESKSWKITKPLRTVNKVFKDKEGYNEE
ncbi:glycosyltransferase family 2 protein [Methanobrevibacter sp.]|uniref:glycosyltransferase family 2 protein n=1 Tax=Methanobrevibacter sp. TaxID=66852 RepID=UPI00388DBB5B